MLVLRKPDEIGQGDDIKRQHHGKRDMHLRRYVHVRILSQRAWHFLERGITFAKRHASVEGGTGRGRCEPRPGMPSG
jgi:hypothetical protein